MTSRYLLEGRLGRLTVRGATLTADVAAAVVDAGLDLSTGEVPQLDLKLYDPEARLLGARLFLPGTPTTAGTPIDYAGLKFECRAVGVDPGGILSVTARDLAACKLKRQRFTPRRGMSRTEAVRLDAAAAGLKFVGEPSARAATVAADARTAWDAHGEWAGQLGFQRWTAGGTLYFGRVSYFLRTVAVAPRVSLAWAGDKTDGRLVDRPTCRRSGDDDNADATVTARLLGDLGETTLPGTILALSGVPLFDGSYFTTSTKLELAEGKPATVTAVTPRNATPQPATVATTSGSRAPSSTPVATGSGTADSMVRYALEQAGDRYVFGAETSGTDADPDAFDCSELVEWACARAGVRFVDGSSAQLARVRRIPVDEGKRTRGALLFHPGHVAISLGDGRTIEAANRKYGVRSLSAGSRFTAAGLIPGLRY